MFLTAALLALVFFFILGIKDLVFVRRAQAYETLLFLLLFFLFAALFSSFPAWGAPRALLASLAAGVAAFSLLYGFFNYAFPDISSFRKIAAAGAAALLLFQGSVALLFLPFGFLAQTILLFLAAVILVQCASGSFRGSIARREVLAYALSFFAVALVVFGSVSWSP